MDVKITMSFDEEIINKAKKFAEANNISLSRLTEYLYSRMIAKPYANLEELPISDWVNVVAEGQVEYKTKSKSRKEIKAAYYSSKK